jgi:NAD(P)-dependent dehydrogenase (short-subunit alcohol dehydrogenase family)
MPIALITGGSRGLGRALGKALAERGWALVVDGRNATALGRAHAELQAAGAASVTSIVGDVADESHRRELASAVSAGLDLLVNNASTLGQSPLPSLVEISPDLLAEIYATNTVAPLALTQLVLPALRGRDGVVVNVSSDAAVEAYPGWGGYGSSKAALDRLAAVLAVEEPTVPIYAIDPGDMRTQMHQDAFPDEDISDRPEPHTVVPALLRLVDERPASGRYTAAALQAKEVSA